MATSPGLENDCLQRDGWLLGNAEAGLEALPVWKTIDGVPLARWFADHRPDVVIGNVDGVYWQLLAEGLRVPEDVAYLNLQHPIQGRFAGFDCGEQEIGNAVVETLDRLVRHNQLGLVPEPTTILVKRHFAGWD